MQPFLLAVLFLAAPAASVKSKSLAARSLAAAGVPDPTCKTGVLSLADDSGKPQACCAGYCGECSDYPTCKSVRGQDSKGACCKSEVQDLKCGGGAAANICLKTCDKSVPPCIMPEGETWTTPDPKARTAAEDCTEAVMQWEKMKAAAAGKGELIQLPNATVHIPGGQNTTGKGHWEWVYVDEEDGADSDGPQDGFRELPPAIPPQIALLAAKVERCRADMAKAASEHS